MSRFRAVIAVLSILATSAALQPAASTAAPSPATSLARAQALVKAIPARQFAGKSRRSGVLKAARRATRLAQRARSCPAAKAVDTFRSAMLNRRTWRKRKIPRSRVRPVTRRLNTAQRALVRRAGTKCGRVPVNERVQANTAAGPYTPLPAPDKPNEQGREPDAELDLPVGEFEPVTAPGDGAGVDPDPRAPGTARSASVFDTRQLGGPLGFFRIADVGVPVRQASPQEVQGAIGGDVVWYTGNSSAAYSVDRGRTFTYLDPSTVLPDGALPFCCDQLVEYAPAQNIFIWLTQYWCAPGTAFTNNCTTAGTGSNRLRVAVATPEAIAANTANPSLAWTYWDMPPSVFGKASPAWFDHSEMAVGRSTITISPNTLRAPGGALIARIPLAQLAARGTITVSYIFDGGNMKPVHGGLSSSTTYVVGNNSLSQARIWSWDESSPTLFRHDINRSTTPIYNSGINGSDGLNHYGRFGIFPGQVDSATLAGDLMYVAHGTGRAYCTSGCGRGETPVLDQVFANPAIQVAVYDVRTWRLVRERWLWNPTLSFGFPALGTTSDGAVGITFLSTAPGADPLPVAGFLTPDEQFVTALPSSRPTTTGDYYGLKPGRTASSLVFGAMTIQNDPPGPRTHWHFIEYGHGDAPAVEPPRVSITSPIDGRVFTTGQTITYVADVFDPQDGRLPPDAIVWREDGTVIGRGTSVTRSGTTAGTHTIQVTATNGEGRSANARISVQVNPPASPNAPVAEISSPPDNTQYLAEFQPDPENNQYYKDVQITASASDPDGDPLTYAWTDSVNGGAATQVSTALSPLLRLHLPPDSPNSEATHDLVLSVSDGTSTTTVPIRIRVYVPG